MTTIAIKIKSDLLDFHRNQQGMETIEVLLLLAAFILPMSYFVVKLAMAISEYYSFVSQVLSSPFL